MTPAELRHEIEEAFRDVEYPGDSFLTDTMDPSEVERVEDIFKGQRWEQWKDTPSRLWSGKYCQTLCFLSEEAFRYYSPLFMLACLFEYKEAGPLMAWEFLLLMVPPEDDPGLLRRYEDRMHAFSAKQLEVLIKFLDYLKDAHDDNVFGEHPSQIVPHVQRFLAEHRP